MWAGCEACLCYPEFLQARAIKTSQQYFTCKVFTFLVRKIQCSTNCWHPTVNLTLALCAVRHISVPFLTHEQMPVVSGLSSLSISYQALGLFLFWLSFVKKHLLIYLRGRVTETERQLFHTSLPNGYNGQG